MKLVLFDIDGTLTDTNRVDTACFVRALTTVFGISIVNTDWSAYPDATDSALVAHLVESQLRRPPNEDEVAMMREDFHSFLEASFTESPATCQPIAGGAELLHQLADVPDCAIAFATGGWESTARLKLAAAGYGAPRFPMSSADDAKRRVDICSIASQRALKQCGASAFESTVYVGDGVWDARAAAQLDYRFVGVASGRDADMLRQEGAACVVSDFESIPRDELFRQLLH